MFDAPQDVLKKLLTYKNTTPERLSTSEMAIANRIEHCTLCEAYWVRRKAKVPDRCPKCHKRGWDRPLLQALLAQSTPTTFHPGSQGGNQP